MKKLLYLFTIFFNAFGFLLSFALIFCIKIESIIFLPITITGCLIFGISFTFTVLDYIHSKYTLRQKKIYPYTQNSKVIINYRDYFATQKSDFIIN